MAEGIKEALKNKKNILYIVLICILIIIPILFNFFSFGDFIYDCGREFLVPYEVSRGEVLIKDIFISYFPLSYQINGLLFKIFGAYADVLRAAGVFSSVIFAIFIFSIAKMFTNKNKAFLITVIVAYVSMFNVSFIFNYILGYSYAFIYASALFTVFLYLMLKYLIEDKFLYPAFLTLGVCFALKIEFIFVIFPCIFLLIYKKAGFKKTLIALFLFILPLLISFLALFIQGFNFSDLADYLIFFKNFISSKILAHYNKIVFHTSFADWILYNLKSFKMFILPFLILFIILYLPLKKKNKPLFWILTLIFSIIFFISLIIKKHFCAQDYFSYLCITSFVILIYGFKNKNYPLVFLTASGLFLAARFNFIYTSSYSVFIMPAILLVNCIFFVEIIKSEPLKKTFLTFLIIISVLNAAYSILAQSCLPKRNYYTEKGLFIRPTDDLQITFEEVVSLIKKTPENSTVLVLPEGPMFNWLAGRETNLKYYQLLPNHIEAIGEEKIVNDLRKNSPDYILITNADYSIYGKSKFCDDFGQKICEFTQKNYSLTKTISNGKTLSVKVYKK